MRLVLTPLEDRIAEASRSLPYEFLQPAAALVAVLTGIKNEGAQLQMQ